MSISSILNKEVFLLSKKDPMILIVSFDETLQRIADKSNAGK